MSDKHFEPIKIIGVVVEEIGVPTNDGTRGSALYAVPFQLSNIPPAEWAELMVRNWDRPPGSVSSMHRPKTLSVLGNRIILNRTTMEEVEKYHLETLKLVINKTNEDMVRLIEAENEHTQQEETRVQKHESEVKDIADRLKFD